MKLVYSRIRRGNFGDDLNVWLWPRVLPGLLDDDPGEYFFGIGTILREAYVRDLAPESRKHVFGSGVGYGVPPRLDASWTVHCVRGPLSARALGIDPTLAITDPAILAVDVLGPLPPRGEACGFVPHHRTAERVDCAALAATAGLRFIDPHDPPEIVMRQIAACGRVIAESMHGAILADAFRVPWIAVVLDRGVLPFKWRDWTASIGLRYRPIVVRPFLNETAHLGWRNRLERQGKRLAGRLGVTRYRERFAGETITGEAERAKVAETLGRLAKGDRYRLSDDRTLARQLDRLRTALRALQRPSTFPGR